VNDDLDRLRMAWQDELDSAAVYRAAAARVAGTPQAEAYRRMAEDETRHAGILAERLASRGAAPGRAQPSLRGRVMVALVRWLGPSAVISSMVEREQAGIDVYTGTPEAELASDEQAHRDLLRSFRGAGLQGGAIAQVEAEHRAASGNALRAAVLGANDGLVSNLSLVMGVAGASMESRAILVTGLAGLLAGAISMALGEWLSVQSSRELFARQLAIEAAELEETPEEEHQELVGIYRAKGLPADQAEAVAARLMADPKAALDTLVREELGFDPAELGGSAWEAAFTSFVLFALGAIVPVAPFLALTGPTAIVVSLIASALGLFAVGAGITLLTGRGLWFSGMRQVLFGLVAAGVTFAIGRLIGVALVG